MKTIGYPASAGEDCIAASPVRDTVVAHLEDTAMQAAGMAGAVVALAGDLVGYHPKMQDEGTNPRPGDAASRLDLANDIIRRALGDIGDATVAIRARLG